MRILFLINELLTVCGVTKHCYHLISGLIEQNPENEYYIIYGGGDSIEKFKNLGVKVILDRNILHEKRSIYRYLTGLKNIYNFVKRSNIQIIHSHHYYAASIAAKAVKFKDVKTILTNHGIIPEVGILNHFEADHIIAVNKHVKEYLLNRRIKNEEDISLFPHGFSISNIDKKKYDKIKIITGGRLVKQKGFDTYIKAIAQLPDKIKNKAEFFLAGSGEDENKLSDLNNQLGANVKFLGVISDFQNQLFHTDIFVMPTLANSEGFPTVLIEAGIAKNLIITTNFRGHNSIINKDNSLIYESGDILQLKIFLMDAISNYNHYSNMINNYYNHIAAVFNQKNMLINTYRLYSKLISNK